MTKHWTTGWPYIETIRAWQKTYSELVLICFFSELYRIMVNKVTFVVLWRWSPQSLPLRSAPGYKYLLWFCKKNDKLNTTHDFLNCLLKTRHAEIHPNGFIALWIMLTCPVTVARAEKSFSWSKPSAGLLWQIEDFILIRHVVSRSIMCSL